jgi:general stress protein 26
MANLQKKIYNKLKKPTLSALATVARNGKPWVRYVMLSADEDLTIRFATFKGSKKTSHIRAKSEVHIICGVASIRTARTWLQIQGKAKVLADAKAKKAHWRPDLKGYFKGPSDPNYVVIEIKPYRVEFSSMSAAAPEVWEPEKAAKKVPRKKKAAKKK